MSRNNPKSQNEEPDGGKNKTKNLSRNNSSQWPLGIRLSEAIPNKVTKILSSGSKKSGSGWL